MTKEEAIMYLKRADVSVGCKVKTKTAEAIEMAIEALQKEPCEDAVSRQAAIDALKMDISIIPFAKTREYVRAAIETVYSRLKDLPPVTPAIKKGK